METVTSQAATSCNDVGGDQAEMELDEVSSEVQEMNGVAAKYPAISQMNSADALVENTAIDDSEGVTELNDPVRNYNERCCACNYISYFCLYCVFVPQVNQGLFLV